MIPFGVGFKSNAGRFAPAAFDWRRTGKISNLLVKDLILLYRLEAGKNLV
jgi:hypothetical protein